MPFKDVVNQAIVDGLRDARTRPEPYVLPTYDLGTRVPLDDVKGLLAQWDEEEFLRKRELGK